MKSNLKTITVDTVRTFSKLDGNRTINNIHVKNIKNQMKDSLELFPPITVNKQTNHIIDGQHRVTAFLDLVNKGELPNTATLDVKYVNISPEDERECAVNANTCSKRWELVDYIYSFSVFNNSYKKLLKWCEEHPLCYPNRSKNSKGKRDYKFKFAYSILKGRTSNNSKDLKNGTFNLTDDDIYLGNQVYSELETILDLLPSKPSALETIPVLWYEFRKLHSMDLWIKYIKKLKKNRTSFVELQRDDKKDWRIIFATVSYEIDKDKVNNKI